jgi:asparagine N-glycosylation enzyme membrane subunit Stt3
MVGHISSLLLLLWFGLPSLLGVLALYGFVQIVTLFSFSQSLRGRYCFGNFTLDMEVTLVFMACGLLSTNSFQFSQFQESGTR